MRLLFSCDASPLSSTDRVRLLRVLHARTRCLSRLDTPRDLTPTDRTERQRLREETRKSTLSFPTSPIVLDYSLRRKKRNKKSIKAVDVIGHEMRGVKCAKANPSQGLPYVGFRLIARVYIASSGDPGYVALPVIIVNRSQEGKKSSGRGMFLQRVSCVSHVCVTWNLSKLRNRAKILINRFEIVLRIYFCQFFLKVSESAD